MADIKESLELDLTHENEKRRECLEVKEFFSERIEHYKRTRKKAKKYRQFNEFTHFKTIVPKKYFFNLCD